MGSHGTIEAGFPVSTVELEDLFGHIIDFPGRPETAVFMDKYDPDTGQKKAKPSKKVITPGIPAFQKVEIVYDGQKYVDRLRDAVTKKDLPEKLCREARILLGESPDLVGYRQTLEFFEFIEAFACANGLEFTTDGDDVIFQEKGFRHHDRVNMSWITAMSTREQIDTLHVKLEKLGFRNLQFQLTAVYHE